MQHDSLPLTSYRPGLWKRVGQRVRKLGERVGRKNHRRLIAALIGLAGVYTLLVVTVLLAASLAPQTGDIFLSAFLVRAAELAVPPIWLVVRLVLQFLVAVLYLLALLRLWRGREEAALNLAIFAALLSFTGVNLLHFYVNQFGALTSFFGSFVLFLSLVAYRSWYLAPDEAQQ